MRKVHYGSIEDFTAFLDIGGFVPIKYKDCNNNGAQEYFINEECNIVHLLSSRKRASKPFDAAWRIYTYNPNTSKDPTGRHRVYIGFSAQLHRVVATTFLDNAHSDTYNDIMFKDSDFDNCHPSNLKWMRHAAAMSNYHKNKANK